MASYKSVVMPRKKDLHDGISLWHDSGAHISTRKLKKNISAEIVVVGAGISGALSALELSAAGHDVVVIDRRAPSTGSTLASTAMIQFELDTPLTVLQKKIGPARANRAYKRSAKAVRDLSKLLETHDISAQWRNREALYLAGGEMGYRGLQKEAEARQKLKLPSEYLSHAELLAEYNINRTGAILSGGSAELNPVATASGCLKAAQTLGARIFSPCEALSATSTHPGVQLETSSGFTISASRVVFATGYEVMAGIPKDQFEVISSWAIATQSLADADFWPGRCLIWEASEPYLYARTTPDNRILVGGGDQRLTDPHKREQAIPRKSAALLKQIKSMLSKNHLQAEFQWGGAFANSPAGLPVFRQLPSIPGSMAILGCGGNGITCSMIAAQVVTKWARGRSDPDLDLFLGT
jgi:glycine/D-amino acid oxidase-like deaminating enzyme